MNKEGHVLNAVLLSVGLGYLFYPSLTMVTVLATIEIGLPVLLGALLPDIDTAFGSHRRTFHNLPVLGVFVAYPYYFGNLHFVWIGVLTHYALDFFGTKRGLALLYPWRREFSVPTGVPVKSDYALVVTVAITLLELLVATAIVGVPAPLATSVQSLLGLSSVFSFVPVG